MSGIVGRLPSITDTGSGDQEKDANSVLMELDKGLRSAKPGEQCEAIVRFPSLFEKYPFPILINSAFLKLGDVFRVGSNLLRLCILRITQQSRKHLDKILNVEEFLRKVYSVIHSNDPLARAITLRLLGSAAHIISDRKKVHQSIINSLESHDLVEVEAAIFAARCFAAQSKSFAVSVLDQLSQVVMRLSTPVDMKLKLLPVLQHMYHEPHTAAKVRELCTKLLTEFPSLQFVVTSLHTLSLLSAKCLTDIPQQVSLLQHHLVNDPRLTVKSLCLRDLSLMARRAPHMWQPDNIKTLCRLVTANHQEETVTIGALQVLNHLAHSIAVAKFSIDEDSSEMECVAETCYHGNMQISSLGASILVYVAIHHNQGGGTCDESLREQAGIALETLLTVITSSQDEVQLKPASLLGLRCVVELCRTCPNMTDRFIDTLCTLLSTLQGERAVTFYECLLAVCSQHNDLLPGLVPNLLQMLEQSTSNIHATLSLATLLFQGSVDDGLSEEVTAAIMRAMEKSCDHWLMYRVGRQATRYGHHLLAVDVFSNLTSQVSSEQNYYWLSGLRECCQAEHCILTASSDDGSSSVPQLMQALTVALNHYHQCRASLRAATTQEFMHIFQLEYVRLRIKMLDSFVQLLHGCSSFRTSPPPATATALATTTGLDIHKCGHVLSQLKTCVVHFSEVYQDYCDLYQSAFNADATSLANIQILQQMCQLMTQVLEYVMASSQQSEATIPGEMDGDDLSQKVRGATEHQRWLSAKHQVHQLLETITKSQEPANTLTYKHLQCIEQTMSTLCSVPLCMPRFFFQKLQHTKIKLALSPQPRSSNEPLSIHYDTCLTLKLEGVIERGQGSVVKGHHHRANQQQISKARNELRKVSQVKLRVKSTQLRRGEVMSDGKYPEKHCNSLTQMTSPHNDYFCCQFILSFPIPGLHQVSIHTAVLDESGMEWNTGPTTSIQVKSYDEAVQRQQQQQYAAQRQQRAAQSASSSTTPLF